MNTIIKFDRFFAWILFVSMVLFFVSGYGITKGVISGELAVKIHNELLPPITIISFVIHSWFAIHLAFKRWRFWNLFTMLFLAVFYILFAGYFGYLQYFYQKPATNNTPQTSSESTTSGDEASATDTTNETTKIFTLAELAKYNGKNGQPAYIAVDGNVYDVSNLFVDGYHRGCAAGGDVTKEFYDEHSKNMLSSYEIVGTLAN